MYACVCWEAHAYVCLRGDQRRVPGFSSTLCLSSLETGLSLDLEITVFLLG